MIDKIDSFFENRVYKIVAYILIFIIIGGVSGFISYNFYVESKEKKKELIKLRKNYLTLIKRVKVSIKKKEVIKKEYKSKLLEYSKIKDNFKYFKYNLVFSKIFVNNKKFYDILSNILRYSSYYNINSNFIISKQQEDFLDKYFINSYGNFKCDNYNNFIFFINRIESMNFIKSFEDVNLFKKGEIVNYEFNLTIWSLK